ncbi:hypothetical protein PMAG_a2539 [Pseudoalteromonas mariniglutinosa NCIMB 1770]|nr:hypothetical protein [Pseudoalteromonas mariniglutinosa NCIMB 1770]
MPVLFDRQTQWSAYFSRTAKALVVCFSLYSLNQLTGSRSWFG